ncbi:MAG: C4-dicarboxylate TRAP transporter substrate-binding protein [Marinosulfonomonas sp.]|nr:C4-dicarboxylate TRAP transporter substrate-binding protein [Marinosulfonomonas sp.]
MLSISQRKPPLRGMFGRVLAVAIGMTIAGQAVAKDLTYASYLSPSHLMNKNVLPVFFDRLREASGGEVNFKLVAGAQLFDNKTSISATGEGLAEATAGLSAYVPNQLPHFNMMFEMAGYVKNPKAGAGAALQTALLECDGCTGDFKKQGVTILGSYGTSSAALFCTSDLSSAEDVKGLKIRVSGSSGRMVKVMGGTPVRMAPTDLVTSMERGNIDCILGPLSWMSSYNLYEMVKTIVLYPFGSFPNAISLAFNTDAYEALSDENRQAILKTLPSLTADLVIGVYENGHDAALVKAKESGIKILEGGADFDALVATYRAGDEAVIAANAAKFGVENPQAVIDTFKANVARWDELVKGVDQAQFEKLLWDEIYSKL